MATLWIGDVLLDTLDDESFGRVLEAARAAGDIATYPGLFAISTTSQVTDPLALADELARLIVTEPGRAVAPLIGALRDDLMAGVAAAEEG